MKKNRFQTLSLHFNSNLATFMHLLTFYLPFVLQQPNFLTENSARKIHLLNNFHTAQQ